MNPSTPSAPQVEPAPAVNVRPTLVTYLLLMILVVVPFLTLLSPYMVALATGAILAEICYPFYSRIRRRLPRWAAGLIVTFALVVLVLAPAGAMGVGAFRQGSAAVTRLSSDDTPTLAEIVGIARRWIPFIDTFGSPAELLVYLKSGITSVSAAASAVVLRQITGFPVVLLQIVLVVLSTYFALVNGRQLYRWIGEKLPLSGQIRHMLADSFRGATNAVVLASIAAAGAQSALMLLGFWVLGVPAALLAAGLTFLLGWVPGLPTVVWVSATIYLYSQGSLARAVVMVVIGVVVGVIDNIVRALVLRGQKALHPMVGLLAILGGIVTFGVPGVFIGPLLACMAIAVLEVWPAVASYCGIPVSGSGDLVPNVPIPRDDD
jgi:predicted PurR-regulated permease PerM